jgi:hypothetical protein
VFFEQDLRCYASVGVAYPGRLVAKAFAAESAVWGIAGFGGPAVASVLVATLGWPSVFLLNLPLGLAAAVVGWRAFPDRVEGAHPLRFDLRGVVVLAAFVVVVLLGVGQVGVWSLPALGAAGLLGWAYWRHSTRHPDPVLAPEHLIGPRYRRDHLIAFLVLAAGLAADSYLPLYLRGSGRPRTGRPPPAAAAAPPLGAELLGLGAAGPEPAAARRHDGGRELGGAPRPPAGRRGRRGAGLRDRGEQGRWCRGGPDARRGRRAATSHILPRYMTATRSLTFFTTARSWAMNTRSARSAPSCPRAG